jgi:hypothetical protein
MEIDNRLRAMALMEISRELALASAAPSRQEISKELALVSTLMAADAMFLLIVELLCDGGLSDDEEEHAVTKWNEIADAYNALLRTKL